MVAFGNAGSTTTGLEIVQTNALVQIFENLPLQLRIQAEAWNPVDAALANKLGQPYEPTRLESPKPSSYYAGARLGVLGMPWDGFPAVSVMADSGASTPEGSRLDFGSQSSISLSIEAIVRSDQFNSGQPNPSSEQIADRIYQEGVVDRRSKRMIEALIQCVAIDRTLGSIIPTMPDPSFSQTNPFLLNPTNPSDKDNTKERVFSMIRIDYNPGVYASWPDASTPSPMVLPTTAVGA